nr:ABC transporter permease [Lysinibacillus timonensis]
MKQFIDECKFILNGKFIITALIAPIIMATVFGYVLQNGMINEAPIAVIDLDQSQKSIDLTNKLDASQYIDVAEIRYEESDPNELLYNENFLGVIYLPKGLEENSLQGIQTNIGFYVDMALSMATGNLRSAVSEVVSTENATVAVGTLKALGLSNSQASGTVSNVSVTQRLLYNPVNDTLNTTIIGFLNTAILSIITGACITIVPRLRMQNQLALAIRNPIGLISRLIPYAVILCVTLYLSLGLLKQVGGMRFEASITQIWIPFIIYGFCAGLFAMALGWSAATPEKAKSFSVIVLMSAFLLGGVQTPVLLLPDILQKVGEILPINWLFKFIRGMGLRGGDLSYFIEELKGFALLTLALLAIVFLLMLREYYKLKKKTVDENKVNNHDTPFAEHSTESLNIPQVEKREGSVEGKKPVVVN